MVGKPPPQASVPSSWASFQRDLRVCLHVDGAQRSESQNAAPDLSCLYLVTCLSHCDPRGAVGLKDCTDLNVGCSNVLETHSGVVLEVVKIPGETLTWPCWDLGGSWGDRRGTWGGPCLARPLVVSDFERRWSEDRVRVYVGAWKPKAAAHRGARWGRPAHSARLRGAAWALSSVLPRCFQNWQPAVPLLGKGKDGSKRLILYFKHL